MKLYTPLALIATMSFLNAYESAFPKTSPETIEVKTIPASKVIISKAEGDYFERSNNLFSPLFQYIQSNDIAMTTPVEAEINPGAMYFYIGCEAALRDLKSTETVTVKELPERLVVSIGIKGNYSESNFESAKAQLLKWLEQQTDYAATGPARAIYWNGPFTPGFLKNSEVHIPIEKVS